MCVCGGVSEGEENHSLDACVCVGGGGGVREKRIIVWTFVCVSVGGGGGE